MFDKLCLLCIFSDASLETLEKHLQDLYSPQIETVYIRLSDKINLLRRASILKEIRTVFKYAEFNIRSVTEHQIHLIAAFNKYVERKET